MTEENKYCYPYPRPAVTTDCVIFGWCGTDWKVLLVERAGEPYKGKWAFPGGFLNMDETAETGALRELQEETGLQPAFVEQLQTFTAVHRDPRGRVITIAFYALVKVTNVAAGDDAAQAKWFSLNQLPPLAFDHNDILQVAFQRLSEKLSSSHSSNHHEFINTFTHNELRKLYDSIQLYRSK